jgi:putative thioredoxin
LDADAEEGAMKTLTEETFDAALEEAEGLVLVDFFADWCGLCWTLGPILARVVPDYEGRVLFVKVDSDQNRRLTQAFGVRSLPTVVLLAPRRPGPGADVVGHFIGVKPDGAIRQFLDKALTPRRGLLTRLKGMFGAKAEGAAEG